MYHRKPTHKAFVKRHTYTHILNIPNFNSGKRGGGHCETRRDGWDAGEKDGWMDEWRDIMG